MKSRKHLLASVAFAVVAATACGSDGDKSGASNAAGGLKNVNVCVGPQIDYAPVYVGVKLGIWEKHGLKVTPSVCPTSPISVASLLKGEKQLANNSVTGIATAIGQGIPAQVVVPVSVQPTKGNTGILVKTSSKFQAYPELAGHTVGTITVQGLFHLGLASAIEAKGGDPKTLKIVSAAPADLGALLDSGKVDAVMIQDPQLTLIKKEYGDKFRDLGNPFGDIAWGRDVVIGALTAATTQIEADPEMYRTFRTAWAEAVKATQDNRPVAEEVVPGYTGLDPALLKDVTWPTWTTTINEANINAMLNQMKTYGFVKEVPTFDKIYWKG